MNGAPGSKALRQMVAGEGGFCKVRGAKHVKMPPALRSQKPIYVLPIQGNASYLVRGDKGVLNADSKVWVTICKELTIKSAQPYENLKLLKSYSKYISSETQKLLPF